MQKQAGQKLLEVKFGLGKFEITNLEIYKNPPVKFNGRANLRAHKNAKTLNLRLKPLPKQGLNFTRLRRR